MKICIVTFWSSVENYGQVLQCYAFQHYLREKGHDAYVLNWRPASLVGGRLTFWRIWRSVMSPARLFHSIKIRLNGTLNKHIKRCSSIAPRRDFDGFRKKYIKFSKRTYRTFKDVKASKDIDADIYCVGSDVVWRFASDWDMRHVVFLDFGSNQAKRVAYSPSFGGAQFNDEINGKIARLLKRFNGVSTREFSGVDLCRRLGRTDAVCVLDPVFLLEREEYEKEFQVPKFRNGYFVYQIVFADMRCLMPIEAIKACIPAKDLKITTVNGAAAFSEDEIWNATMPEWIRMMGSAKLVFTNSFHGVAMCITMHTPFVVFLNSNGSGLDDRLLSIVRRMGLLDRIYDGSPNFLERIFTETIDWGKVDVALEAEKKVSRDFLGQFGM